MTKKSGDVLENGTPPEIFKHSLLKPIDNINIPRSARIQKNRYSCKHPTLPAESDGKDDISESARQTNHDGITVGNIMNRILSIENIIQEFLDTRERTPSADLGSDRFHTVFINNTPSYGNQREMSVPPAIQEASIIQTEGIAAPQERPKPARIESALPQKQADIPQPPVTGTPLTRNRMPGTPILTAESTDKKPFAEKNGAETRSKPLFIEKIHIFTTIY